MPLVNEACGKEKPQKKEAPILASDVTALLDNIEVGGPGGCGKDSWARCFFFFLKEPGMFPFVARHHLFVAVPSRPLWLLEVSGYRFSGVSV